MIATKFIFCKFRHVLSPDQKAAKQANFYIFKKTNCYLDVLLDQDDCRVNFAVNVNLAKNLLVKFRFMYEATKFRRKFS